MFKLLWHSLLEHFLVHFAWFIISILGNNYFVIFIAQISSPVFSLFSFSILRIIWIVEVWINHTLFQNFSLLSLYLKFCFLGAIPQFIFQLFRYFLFCLLCFFKKYLFIIIFLAAPGLHCGLEDLWPLVGLVWLLVAACGIQFPDQGSNLGLPH